MILGKPLRSVQHPTTEHKHRQGYSFFAWLPCLLRDGRYAWLQTVWVCQDRVTTNEGIVYSKYETGEVVLTYFATHKDMQHYMKVA